MKHILIVGGIPLVPRKIKEYKDIKMTLMIKSNELKDQDSKCFDRIIALPEDAVELEWINQALLIHNMDKFNSIGAYDETNQVIASAIAKEIGLEFHERHIIENTRDKFLMRKLLSKAGIDDTPFTTASTIKDIDSFTDLHEFPIIIKPKNGWGSKGVSIIRNKKEIEPAIEWFSKSYPNEEFYVEKYLIGQEYSVEAFSEDGKHKVICITKQFNNNDHMIEVGHVIPAELGEKETIAIEDLVYKVLNLLNVKKGASHTEIILTEDGPRIIETHVRLAGDLIPDMIQIASGIDLYDIWARQTLGEKIFHEIEEIAFKKYCSIWFKTPEAKGVLVEVKGVETEKSKEGIERIYTWKPGSKIKGLQDSSSRISFVISSASNEEDAVKKAKQSSNNLRFIIEC